MRNLAFYIFDSRYSAPNLNFAVGREDDDGRSEAERLLLQSPFHLAVEVRVEDEILLRLERDAFGRSAPTAVALGNDGSRP